MFWNPIILGIIEDFYSLNVWIFLPMAIIGFLLCFLRFKLILVVLPIVLIICGFFLAGFLEEGNYNHISQLDSSLIPKAVLWMLFSIALPITGALLSWRKRSKLN